MNPIKITLLATLLAMDVGLIACSSQNPQDNQRAVAEANKQAADQLRAAQDKQAKKVSEASRDLQTSEEKAHVKIADQRADLNDTTNAANQDVAKARASYVRDAADATYDVATTKAEGDYKVAQERCESLSGDAKDACNTTAKTMYERAIADAKNTLEETKRRTTATESHSG